MRQFESVDDDEGVLLGITAAEEAASEHPLGRAMVEAARERGLNFPDVSDFQAESSRGVVATVDEESICVGSPACLASQSMALSVLQDRIEASEQQGHTMIAVARGDRLGRGSARRCH